MVRVRFIWFDTFQYSQLVRSRITKNFSFPRIRPNLPKFITFSRNMVYELWEKRKFLVLTTPSIQYQSPPAIQKTREIYLLRNHSQPRVLVLSSFPDGSGYSTFWSIRILLNQQQHVLLVTITVHLCLESAVMSGKSVNTSCNTNLKCH